MRFIFALALLICLDAHGALRGIAQASGSGGSGIAGSIAPTQIAFGDTTPNSITSSNSLTYTGAAIVTAAAGTLDLGVPNVGVKRVFIDYTNTLVVGPVTINKANGRVNVPAGQASVVVTNALVTANTNIIVVSQKIDPVCAVKGVVAAAGSFTIQMNTPCAANNPVSFFFPGSD